LVTTEADAAGVTNVDWTDLDDAAEHDSSELLTCANSFVLSLTDVTGFIRSLCFLPFIWLFKADSPIARISNDFKQILHRALLEGYSASATNQSLYFSHFNQFVLNEQSPGIFAASMELKFDEHSVPVLSLHYD